MSEPTRTIDLPNLAATERLGIAIASAFDGPLVIGLVGDLGAGKTTLVRAIATAAGVPSDDVTSPTFTLVREYPADPPLFHFDTYRLAHPDEFGDLGFEEYETDGVCLVEWADRVADWLPTDRVTIRLETLGVDSRRAELIANGDRSTAFLARPGLPAE